MNAGRGVAGPEPAPALELRAIEKRYAGGVRANGGVDFTLRRGEIHAIVGDNGAGKTTLMKVACGLVRPDSGTILRKGKRRVYPTPRHALADGIAMVRQELGQPERLSVAENVVLGAEPVDRLGLFDARDAGARTEALADRFGWRLNPRARLAALSVGDRQRVEILRAVHRDARVLLLDEPFSALGTAGRESLREGLRTVVEDGTSVVVVSHKIREVSRMADRITFMRDGRVATVLTDADAIAKSWATSELVAVDPPAACGRQAGATALLSVRELRAVRDGGGTALRGVGFTLGGGEIVGLAGVGGNGQRELVDILMGDRPAASGAIRLRGVPLQGKARREIRRLGVGHVPADRGVDGVAASESVRDNLIVSRHRFSPFSRLGWLDHRAARSFAGRLLEDFGIVAAGVEAPVSSLSGGNAQKLILARELSAQPDLLIAEQPTRGVDAGSTRAIRARLRAERDHGVSILLVSSDTEELLALSDRILVLYDGRVTATLDEPASLSGEDLGRYMVGMASGDAPA